MLVSEYLAIVKDHGVEYACAFLFNDLKYYEICDTDGLMFAYKKEANIDLVIPEDKKSKIGFYYRTYEDQKLLGSEGGKPKDFFPINTMEDIKNFLKDIWNLDLDDRIDQWGVNIY